MRELKVDFNVPEIDHHEFYYVEGKKIPCLLYTSDAADE